MAGEIAARVNNVTLEEYMEKHIWGPLGMTEFTFHLSKNVSVKDKLADMSYRDGGVTMFGTVENQDAKVIYTDESVWSHETQHYFGGAGAYGNVVQYQRMLHSICADDGKLLKSSTIDQMFQNQLTPAAKATYNGVRHLPAINNIFGGEPPEELFDIGLGGALNEASFPGRSAGTLSWGGLPNLLWFIDRKAGISGSKFEERIPRSPNSRFTKSTSVIATQIIPPGDPKLVQLNHAWKEAMYKAAGIQVLQSARI